MPKSDKCFSSCRQQPKSKCTNTARCNYTDGKKYKYCRLSRKYIMSKTKDGHCITQKRGHKQSLTEKPQSVEKTQSAKERIGRFILNKMPKSPYKLDKAQIPPHISPIKLDNGEVDETGKSDKSKTNLAKQKIGRFILNAVERRKREKQIKAEFDARQIIIDKVRRSMFRHKIGKFMKNTTQKRRTEFLKAICSDSGVCIAFGREDNKIIDFFNGFTKFNYVDGPIKRRGQPSQNGFIHEIKYSRGGYNAYTMLKSSAKPDGDNLFYEYMVGRYLNHLCQLVPCFVETYGLFRYDSLADWNFAKNNNEIPLQTFKNSLLRVIPNHNLIIDHNLTIDKSCRHSEKISIMIQHIKNAETLTQKLDAMRDRLKVNTNDSVAIDFAKIHLLNILYQVYNPLVRFANTFTHYDLHAGNVLLYVPNANKYIQYHYHNPNGSITEFKSHYLVKIIDYGRAFFKDTLSQPGTSSTAIYKAVCQDPACPDCGYDKGYRWLDPEDYPGQAHYIWSQVRNASHDLRLLKVIRDQSRRVLRLNPSLEMVINAVKYDGDYGTEEVVKHRPNEIVNIVEALNTFTQMVNDSSIKAYNDMFYSTPLWSKLGDLHVYSDGQPMNFVPSTIKIS